MTAIPNSPESEIDKSRPGSSSRIDCRHLALVDGDERRPQAARTAIFDAAQTIRGFVRMFQDLPEGFYGDLDEDQFWRRQPTPAGWSALQHTAHFADLLAGIAADLSYLFSDDPGVCFALPAGPDPVSNDRDPQMVLAVLAGDAERVARLLESSPNAGHGTGFAIAAGGVVVDLAYRAVRDGWAHLRAAYQAFHQPQTGTNPTATTPMNTSTDRPATR